MREAFDMMAFVNAAYVLTVVTTAAVLIWSWTAMRRAEKKREETRGK